MITDYRLFLGFPIDPIYEKELLKSNQRLIDQFIQSRGDYLREVSHGGMRYFGVEMDKLAKISEIDLKESFIYSILKILVKDYRYEEIPLTLFPIPEFTDATR